MSELKLFAGSSGLNTKVDPVRVKYDPDNGVSDMVEGINIVIDETLRPKRRYGFTLAQAGNYHSLFCDGGDCFIAMDTALYQVGTDLSLTGIRSGLSGDRIAFCQVNSETYYSNALNNGVIRDGVSDPWPAGTYTGPETTRRFQGPPVGSHLALHLGRMFISVGDILWWSEPYAYGLYDKVRAWMQLPSHIRMIKPVESGMYISDSRNTYFLSGKAPEKFILNPVAKSPAYEWSEAIDLTCAQDIGLESSGLCAVWASPEGAVLGLPSGQILKLNNKKVAYPTTLRHGAGLVSDTHFVHTLF